MSHQGDDDLFSGRRGPRGDQRNDQRNDRRGVNVKGSSQGSSDQGSEAKCFAAAVRLVAGREYSVKELSAKLLRRFSADAVANVVAEMQAEGYVCNTRYGEAFCRSRVARGYGPVFIARELEQNGLDSDLIDALLQPHEDRWLEYAIAQVEKKASRGRSRGALFDHASAADSESDDAENREFDETGSADQRREAWQRDQKERGRLARFLARRGFSGAIASRAIKIGLSGQQQNDDEC